MLWLLSALIFICLAVFWAIGAHSRLTALYKAYTQAFAQIGTQIKQRHQAMLALAEKLADVTGVDKKLLEDVSTAHHQAMQANIRLAEKPLDTAVMLELTAADNSFTQTLANFMTVAALQANASSNEYMLRLAGERTSMDNRIAFARQGYNQTVEQYNAAIKQFPSSLIAALFSLRPALAWQGAEPPIERRQEHRSA